MTKTLTHRKYIEIGEVSLSRLLEYNKRINRFLEKKGLQPARPEKDERLSTEFSGENLRLLRETTYDPHERRATNSYRVLEGRLNKGTLAEIKRLSEVYGFRKAE